MSVTTTDTVITNLTYISNTYQTQNKNGLHDVMAGPLGVSSVHGSDLFMHTCEVKDTRCFFKQLVFVQYAHINIHLNLPHPVF